MLPSLCRVLFGLVCVSVWTGCLTNINEEEESKSLRVPGDLDQGHDLGRVDMAKMEMSLPDLSTNQEDVGVDFGEDGGVVGDPCKEMMCGAKDCVVVQGEASCVCVDGEQDNDEDGVCQPACIEGEELDPAYLCDDASGEAVYTLVYPESCLELQEGGESKDGLYTLFVSHQVDKPWDAACVGMKSSKPKTYLPLGVTSGRANRFQKNDQNGLLAETSFWMVQLDPVALKVHLDDFTFSSTVMHQDKTLEQVPFGTVESCIKRRESEQSWEAAKGQINLSNTPFRIDAEFEHYGRCSAGVPRLDANPAKIVDLEAIGGERREDGSFLPTCGRMGPSEIKPRYGLTCAKCMDLQFECPEKEDFSVDKSVAISLQYVSGVTQATLAPTTCVEIKLANPLAKDGEYTLYADRDPKKPWQATCVGMDQVTQGVYPLFGVRDKGPKEYIQLVEQAQGDNVMREVRSTNGQEPEVWRETQYRRVRFDPRSSRVDVRDGTYATAAIDKSGTGELVGFGEALNTWSESAMSRINLEGTKFVVSSEFEAWGVCPGGGAMFSGSRDIVDLESRGQNGGISPQRLAKTKNILNNSCGVVSRPGGYLSETRYVLGLEYP